MTERKILSFTFAALASATMSAVALAQEAKTPASPAATENSFGRKLQLEGVPNFGEVTATLYRGAQPTKLGFRNLAQMGIGIVVDLRGSRDSERDQVTKLGMQYVPIPWRCFHPEDKDFSKFLTLLRENLDKKIFVHCRTGGDRTGMEVAAYRMAEQGWSAQEARKEMEAFGFSLFHRTICPGLASFEEDFPSHLKTRPEFKDLRPADSAPEPRSP